MSTGPTRNLWLIVLQNFIRSFRPRQIRGNVMGQDYIGNKYFEIPADPSLGKRKPVRWYDPPKGNDFTDPLPSEWDSWLRLTRTEPPTEEEISKNLAIAEMKKVNAAKLEQQRLADGGSLPSVPETGRWSFPSYPEYHGGEGPKEGKK